MTTISQRRTIYTLALSFLMVAAFAASAFAQITTIDILPEKRPFDFSDRFYKQNGIAADLLAKRVNGADSYSVFDYIESPDHRGIRIVETRPAYDASGDLRFWNYYAGIAIDAFTPDAAGHRMQGYAHLYPIYFFPSATTLGSERQAAMIAVDDTYFEKNMVGTSVTILVEYTPLAKTAYGKRALARLLKGNGASLDGTPIIRTAAELEQLTNDRLVVQRETPYRTLVNTPYIAGRVIADPTGGTVAPDAFLHMVITASGDPLDAEVNFVRAFECLKSNGRC